VLSAIACVAFMGSAFASNEIVLEKQVATIQSTTNNNGDDDAIKCSVTLTDQYGIQYQCLIGFVIVLN